MTRPRIVDPGATLALCRRTTRRHFLRARRKAANAINACSVVGHPGLEPGANGLRKAIYDSLSSVKRKGSGS
jgi:hypothetical protein